MRSPRFLLAPAVLALGLALTACAGKPENSPVIRKKFADMDQLSRNVADMQASIQTMSSDVHVLTDQLSELRATSPEGASGAEILKRIDTIEAKLKMPGGKVTNVANHPGDDKTPVIDASLVTSELAGAAPKADAKVEKIVADVPKPVKKSTPKKASKPAPPKVTGKYYTVEGGDTPEKIASANGIDMKALLGANGLPSGAKLLPGRTLFVPAKK